MIKEYYERPPRIKAVELNVPNTLGSVVELIQADSYQVDAVKGEVAFSVGDKTYTAKQGQFVALSGDEVKVIERQEFYDKYQLEQVP